MEITFNNQKQFVQVFTSLHQILAEKFGTKTRGIAVAVNGAIIPRPEWENYVLQADDTILVVTATQGG